MSGVICVNDKYVVLYCEGFTSPPTTNLDEVKQEILADLREKRLRQAMATEYAKLTDTAQIDNILTGFSKSPEKGNPVEQILGGSGLLAEPDAADAAPRGKPANSTSRPKGGTVKK
jgi:hypothetical protein